MISLSRHPLKEGGVPSTAFGDLHICASCSYLLVYLSIISVSFDTWYLICHIG
jgi:hypothetical protein